MTLNYYQYSLYIEYGPRKGSSLNVPVTGKRDPHLNTTKDRSKKLISREGFQMIEGPIKDTMGSSSLI